MTQKNSNASNVLPNTSSVLNGKGGTSTSGVPVSNAGIDTALSSVTNTTGGFDSTTENGNYKTAVDISTKATAAAQTATLFSNIANQAYFLPTNGATVTSGEFNATGNYRTAASWTATPTLTGNASAFTLTDNADSGKTFTLAENISGSPFTTNNGAVSEAITFTGKNSDTLVIQHKVVVSNVPALTNNNTGSALDVRNESYAENYVKTGVTSNYGLNTTHKYAEVTGNQSLNDALAETFAYKDAGLTINSAVKTAVADASYLNGAEKIVENNAANYHYASTVASTAGTIDYVVTDVRNLVQADQRTYTNITTTNLAQFKVVDKTVVAANGGDLTVEANGVIVGTATNIAPTTVFAPTNAKFTVSNTAYSLAVDAGQFTANALNQNVFDNVLGTDGVTVNTATGLGNGGTLFTPIDDTTNQPVVPAALASAKYFVGATFTGTDFADAITIKDVVSSATGVTPVTYAGGKVNAGAGNDTITGSKGNDTIAGGDGKDSFVVTGGTDTISDYKPATPEVKEVKAVAADPTAKPPVLKVDAVAPVAEVVNDTITIKVGASALIKDGGNGFYTVTNPSTATADKTIKTDADWQGVKSTVPTFDYSKETDLTINGTKAADNITGNVLNNTITGGDGADLITGGTGADTIILTESTVAGAAGSDTVIYTSATADALKTEGSDVLTGFATTKDKIQFTKAFAAGALVEDKGTALTTALGAADFASNAKAITADKAHAGRFVFDAKAGKLFFDVSGDDTAAVNAAPVDTAKDDILVFTGVTTLAATDFVIA